MDIFTENNIKQNESNDSLFSLYSIDGFSKSTEYLLEDNLNRNYKELINNKINKYDNLEFYTKNYRCSKSCNNLLIENFNKVNLCQKKDNLSKSYDDVSFIDKDNFFFEDLRLKRRRQRDYKFDYDNRSTPTIDSAINIIRKNLSSPSLNMLINSARK